MTLLVVAAAALVADVQLLTPGVIHGEEFPSGVASGQTWYGLYQTEQGAELREHVVTVKAVEDAIFDGPGETTGKEATFEQPNPEERPLFLLRGVTGLKAGELPTVFCGYRFIHPGEAVPLSLGKAPHLTLAAVGRAEYAEALPRYYGPVIRGYALEAIEYSNESGAEVVRIQPLSTAEELSNDGRPALVWAGDLDGDGLTDLVMNLTDHYNVSDLRLFLSTRARLGEILGEACRFVTTGC